MWIYGLFSISLYRPVPQIEYDVQYQIWSLDTP